MFEGPEQISNAELAESAEEDLVLRVLRELRV
jgi:hypothetical protein